MLVNLLTTFDTPDRRWFQGENPDVDPSIARQWIANGWAVADTTPPQAWIDVPAVQALVSGYGKRVSGQFGLFSSQQQAVTATYTPHMQFPALGPFYGVRLGICNRHTSDVTLAGARVATPAVDLANANTLTWSEYVTWGGSSTPTFLAAAASATPADAIPVIGVSDVLMRPSVARTDDPTKRPLLQTVVGFATAGSAQACGNTAFAEILAASGLQFASRIQTSDMSAAPGSTSSTPSAAGTFVSPNFVEFLYSVPSRTIADCGDSRTRGQNSASVTVGYNTPVARMCWMRNGVSSAPPVIWSPLSFGVSGQKHAASYATGKQIAAVIRPDWLVADVYSANDVPVTQASIDQAWAEVADLASVCDQYGVRLAVRTAPPFGRSEAEDAFRLTINARLLSSGLFAVDVATPMQTPGAPRTLLAAYNSGDDIHPNQAGYDLVAQLLDAAIPRS